MVFIVFQQNDFCWCFFAVNYFGVCGYLLVGNAYSVTLNASNLEPTENIGSSRQKKTILGTPRLVPWEPQLFQENPRWRWNIIPFGPDVFFHQTRKWREISSPCQGPGEWICDPKWNGWKGDLQRWITLATWYEPTSQASHIPYHPCMVYLPTFTIKINQM